MGVIIAIDCGNTLIKATVFSGERVLITKAVPHERVELIYSLAASSAATMAIVVATGRHVEAVVKAVSRQCEVMTLNRDSRLPYPIAYDTRLIGMDRVAAAAGAAAAMPGRRVLVADAGTALTLDVVDTDGTLMGGYILPGISLMLRSLHEHTALLPELDVDGDKPVAGELPRDTAHAMRWGAMLAAAAAVDACVARHDCDMAILTGGNAALLRQLVTCDHAEDDLLVARGLKTILQYNINNGYV